MSHWRRKVKVDITKVDRSLFDVSDEMIHEGFRDDGVVWLRGFNANEDEFFEFVSRFTTKLVDDSRQERAAHPTHSSLFDVDHGHGSLSCHFELAPIPNRPDLIAFLCITPASIGGQTIYCDGRRVVSHLPEQTRALLRSKQVRTSFVAPPSVWRGFGQLNDVEDHDEAVELFAAKYPLTESFQYRMSANGWMQFASVKDIIAPYPGPNDPETFCMTIKANYGGMQTRFSDGEEIPDEVQQDLDFACRQSTRLLEWAPGDFALIDNLRVMHGRNHFEDSERQIYVMLGNRNF